MTSARLPFLDDLDARAGVPRSNGEPVFHAPWQSRAFGMVVHLHVAGLYPWEEFKQFLITEIDAAGDADTVDPSVYYQQFSNAFYKLLLSRGIVTPDEVAERTRTQQEEWAHDH